MTVSDRLTEVVTHPATALALLVSGLLSLLGQFAPVWDFVAATASTWYPIVAAAGATLLPKFGFPSIGETVLIVGTVVFVAVYLDRFLDRLTEYLNR